MNTVTQEEVDGAIESKQILTLGKKTTACLITLKNGYEIVGTSACVDPASYSEEKGAPYAEKRAIDKVWELLGFVKQG